MAQKRPTQKQIEDKFEKTAQVAESVAANIQMIDAAKKRAVGQAEHAPEDPQVIRMYGACRFCGQARNVIDCRSEEEANEYATRHCNCGEAQEYQADIKKKEHRQRVLKDCASNLDDLFGRDIQEEKTMRMLRSAAEQVYDKVIASISVRLSYTVSVKISRNAKDNISIERKDALAQKVEI